MTFSFNQQQTCQNGLNALRIIAKSGDLDAIEEQLTAGGNVADAVYGLAFGGHVDKVKTMIANYSERTELPYFAAMGYARADREEAAGAMAKNNHADMKLAIVLGYAQSGNLTQINGAIRSQDAPKYLASIVAGLASGGHQTLLERFAISTELQNIAITAAAKSGNTALVNYLLSLQDINMLQLSETISPAQKQALGHALTGYSEGRHFAQIETLLSVGLNPMLCLTAIRNNSTIDASDAQALVDSVKKTELCVQLKELMKNHFSTDTDKLDFDAESYASPDELADLLNSVSVEQPLSASGKIA